MADPQTDIGLTTVIIPRALAATAHDQMGWAAAEVIVSCVNLPIAVVQLQLAAAAAVDMAHLTRDIALTEATLTEPARSIAMRAQADVERDVERGESATSAWTGSPPAMSAPTGSFPSPTRSAAAWSTLQTK